MFSVYLSAASLSIPDCNCYHVTNGPAHGMLEGIIDRLIYMSCSSMQDLSGGADLIKVQIISHSMGVGLLTLNYVIAYSWLL